MKKIIVSLCASLALLSLASAQSGLSTLQARDARSMGIGGCFTALSLGYDSLYGNPAGFAAKTMQLTLPDVSVWAYVKPSEENIAAAQGFIASAPDTDTIKNFANKLITENGLGAGASVGFGLAGRGLGIGVYSIADLVATGDSLMGASLSSSVSVNFVLGLGFPIELGPLTLNLGADFRPFLRADSADGGWLFSSFVSALQGGGDAAMNLKNALMSETVDAGFGLAVDMGAQLVLGSLSLGLTARDLTPTYITKNETVSALISDLAAGQLPQVGDTATDQTLYPALYLGLAWRPVLIAHVFEPGIYVEVQDPIAIIRDKASVWNLIHAGADLKLLSFATIRAGLNKGWLSAGLGLNLYLVEINAAVFTEELGALPGDNPRSGFSIQASIHI